MAASKKIELEAKKEELEKELGRVCCAIADVENELSEVKIMLIDEERQKNEIVDHHLEGIRKYISLLDKRFKEEDLRVLRVHEYKREMEEELPYEYQDFFDYKSCIYSQCSYEKIMIVHVKDNVYRKLGFLERVDDLFDYKAMYYVVVVTTEW